jgi:hypothetical protein
MNAYAEFSRSLQDDIAMSDSAAALRSFAPMSAAQSIFALGPWLQPRGAAAVMRNPIAIPIPATGSRAVQLVRRALEDPRFDFRPLDRIIEATGLSLDEALKALNDPNVARRPWGSPGSNLFTTAKRPVSARELLSALRSVIAKRSSVS